MLLGLIVDWGGTGATNSGIGTPYSLLTPTYYFGQGFGELPDTVGWLRAVAVTGQIGYQIPTRSYDLAQNRSTFRKCWSTAHRCNTACRISNRR